MISNFENNRVLLKPLDLTNSQMQMWTGQLLSPDKPLYNMVLTFNIKGEIQENYFQKAFQELVNRTDALRTVFFVENGIPKQKVLPQFSYSMEILDWTKTTDTKTLYKKWASERAQQLLDLSECLFDSVLIKISGIEFNWYFSQHHLITDAWSVSVLYQLMADLYQNTLQEEMEGTPKLPDFQDFIEYEIITRSSPEKEKVHQHWKEKLFKLPPAPLLYGRSNLGSTTRADRALLDLGQERSAQLRAMAQEREVRSWTPHLSLFNIFSTALFAYLFRVSGQRKLAIGTPAHNRPTPSFKQTPGVFMEVFPLLAEIGAEDNFNTLLQKVRGEAYSFLRYAQPGMSTPELNRKFNVVLNYIHAAFSGFNELPMQSEWIHPQHCDPRHHLRLQVHDFDATGSIQLYFDMNCEVFDVSQRNKAPQHFLKILDAILDNREQPVGQPPLISEREKQKLVVDFNSTKTDFPENETVISLFEKQSKNTPHGVALSFGGKDITYETLNKKVHLLAEYLQKMEMVSGPRVAIFLRRSPELIISILAVLKVGGTYVPIASDYPKNRVVEMLEDSQASFVLTKKELGGCLEDLEIPTLQMEEGWEILLQNEMTEVASKSLPMNGPVTVNSMAYLMYTSGSTGRPKGVMISNKALTNYILWAQENYVIKKQPAFPLFTMIGFDLTVTSIFLPLICGGNIVIYQEKTTGPDLSLFEVMEENKVDVIKLTPAHLALLKEKDYQHSRIRTMIVGGEDFKTELAQKIKKTFHKDLTIYNEYGPTEATVGCMLHRFESQKIQKTSIPIGRPAANMQVYILDEFKNPVPKGIPGELYLAGAGLADGYWNQAVLTDERFVANRFEQNSKMYRTGDLARMNNEYELEFLGRTDQQIKIGGIRIEPGEVETALSKYPGIRDSVVVIRQRQNGRSSIQYCTECGLPSNYPDSEFDEAGVCHLCHSFETYQEKAKQYFKTKDELMALFKNLPAEREYDCIMLLSGGKDSTYALGQLVEMGLKVLAFTLDNGYISEQALANVRRVVKELGVDCIFGSTPAMNEIFVDSLKRHCNVCNGCFKTIYTLSMKVALEKNIPYIVTGLSRGQFFETRLTEELFWNDQVDVEKIDQTILDARKTYHQVDDAVNRLLDVSMFEDEQVFEKVQFLDFYRYTDVSLQEMLDYLDERLPWSRPTDTGRSTNCLINQVGIYVHKKQKGYNNYAYPYSWDVRIGHKTREAALEEINETVNEVEVRRIMDEIGYQEKEIFPAEEKQLVAFYVSDTQFSNSELRGYLSKSFPSYMVPTQFKPLDVLPLTPNGKIDRQALHQMTEWSKEGNDNYVAPANEIEKILVDIFSEVLQIEPIGVQDDFLEIGGNSLAAIRLIARMNKAFELELPVNLVFQKPTIAGIAEYVEETIGQLLAELDE